MNLAQIENSGERFIYTHHASPALGSPPALVRNKRNTGKALAKAIGLPETSPKEPRAPLPPKTPDTELAASAISPSFVGTAVEIKQEIEYHPTTGEPIATPLDDALGKRYVRFGHHSARNEYGFIFRNEDNSVWQVKRGLGHIQPNGRSGQYLAPKGIGNRAYFPAIPDDVLMMICDRHGLPYSLTQSEIQAAGGFWPWVKAHPELPIIITEGAKKSLAALSQGYITIALYGCTCGRSDDLQQFFTESRQVIVAFDVDTKPTARKAVKRGIGILRGATTATDVALTVARWQPSQGKGLDDLIALSGSEALDTAIAGATPHALWQARSRSSNPLGLYKPNLQVNVPCLGTAIATESIPNEGTVVLYAGMGTGKTKLIAKLLENAPGAIAPGHSIGLQRGLGYRLNLHYIDDCDTAYGYLLGSEGQPTNRIALCWDSLLKLPRRTFPEDSYDLVLDEIDQGLRHLLRGGTCGKRGLRPGLMKRARALIQGARRVICASATLSWWDIELIAKIRGEIPWILQNSYQSDRFPVTLYTGSTRESDLGAVLVRLQQALEDGKRVMVASDQKRVIKALEVLTQGQLKAGEFLSYHADNSSNPDQRLFAAGPDEYLKNNNIRLLPYSPSLTSGVSIEGSHFDLVVGLFFGQSITPADAIQQLGRVRPSVERVVWCAAHGRGNPEKWAEAYKNSEAKRTKAIAHLSGQQLSTLTEDDPISEYLATSGARKNLEMANFGAFLQARLEMAGHPLTVTTGDFARLSELKTAYRGFLNAMSATREQEINDRVNAPIITTAEAKVLRNKSALQYEEACKLERHDIADFLAIAPKALGYEEIKRDRYGQYRQEITRLECLLYEDLAAHKDGATLKELTQWQAPIPSHDLPKHKLQSEGAIALGLPALVERCLKSEGWNRTTDWIVDFANFAQARRDDIRTYLGFNIRETMTPCQVVGMCLKSLGIRTASKRITTSNGDRQWQYTLNTEELNSLKALLQRRSQYHRQQGLDLRPGPITDLLLRGMANEDSKQDTLRHLEQKIERDPPNIFPRSG